MKGCNTELISFLFSDSEVCIIGVLDNNYLCWRSITSLSERETNLQIFQYFLNLNPTIISNQTVNLSSELSICLIQNECNEFEFYIQSLLM